MNSKLEVSETIERHNKFLEKLGCQRLLLTDNILRIMMDFVPYRLEENEVIQQLITTINKPGRSSDIRVFGDALCRHSELGSFREYKGLYIGTNIKREELGLPGEGQKPGDIDILVIPYKENEILFERASAYEVKVVRPTRQNRKKRPNSFGVNQLLGYVEDGFPFVSAIHICMTEPSLPNEKTPLPFIMQPAGDGREQLSDNTPPLEAYEMYGHDWFPTFAVNNHMRRMIAAGLPKYIGLNIEAWNLDGEGRLNMIRSFEYDDFSGCFWNPKRKRETVDLMATHLQAHPERYQHVPLVWIPSKWEPKEKPIMEGVQEIVPDTDIDGNEVASEEPVRIQSLFESTKTVLVDDSKYHSDVLCFRTSGNGMDDGTEKAIQDGNYIFVKDLGLPALKDVPCFQPVGLVRFKGGKLSHVVCTITKKHLPSQVLRLSFYNPAYHETWIRYSTVKQVFEVVEVFDEDEVRFSEE